VNPEFFSVLGALLAAVISASIGFLTSRRARAERPQPQPLEDLLQQLTTNATESGRLATLVQTEIQAQLTQVEKLRKDASEAEHLAALHGAAADAVAAQFKAAVASESKKTTRAAFLSSALFYVAGVASSIFVGLLLK
jgi:hypothetical protein